MSSLDFSLTMVPDESRNWPRPSSRVSPSGNRLVTSICRKCWNCSSLTSPPGLLRPKYSSVRWKIEPWDGAAFRAPGWCSGWLVAAAVGVAGPAVRVVPGEIVRADHAPVEDRVLQVGEVPVGELEDPVGEPLLDVVGPAGVDLDHVVGVPAQPGRHVEDLQA